MTNAATIEFRFQRRTLWLGVGLFLLSSCGGGSGPATQQSGSNPLSVPSPESTLAPTPTATVTTGPPAIVLSHVAANPGATAFVNVSLMSRGQTIAGLQTDLAFPPGVQIAARSDGRPDCSVNADINKGATSFVFLPNFCTGAACTGMRAIVWASDNIDPILDRSILFACKLQIDLAAAGTLALRPSQVIMSDPSGRRIDGEGVNGVITVSGPPLPTETATPTAPPGPPATATPTAAPIGTVTHPSIVLGRVSGAAGSVTRFDATLVLPDHEIVAAAQNDIAFPPDAHVSATTTGKPDCTVNPDIVKNSTSFVFQPPQCTGAACIGMRALVLSLDSVEDSQRPIPDGAVLYTCRAAIDPAAQGTLPLAITGVVMADPDGNSTPDAEGIDGSIAVSPP